MRLLIVAAHPDDEVLGCGATMALHADIGDDVYVLFMTDGVGARSNASDGQRGRRAAASASACDILGVKGIEHLTFPDNSMDACSRLEIMRTVEAQLEAVRPDLIYTHHAGDLNIDHRLVHEAVMTACRPQPGCEISGIFSFEVLSSTGWSSPSMGATFTPQRFVEATSDTMALKMLALEAYVEEMRPSPHARSMEAVRALAVMRGHSIGVSYAEAFVVEREVVTRG